jgi:hypothetical protein
MALTHTFSARVYKLGINPCVDVPKSISDAFAQRGYIAVKGMLNGEPIRATLVPKGGGRHRLYLNTDMRTRAQVEVGDRVTIEVSLDTRPRVVPVPATLERALKKNRKAKAAFERLKPSRQKEILLYLNSLKQPESLARNVEKVVAQLLKHADE